MSTEFDLSSDPQVGPPELGKIVTRGVYKWDEASQTLVKLLSLTRPIIEPKVDKPEPKLYTGQYV